MSVVCVGGISTISLIILPPVRNATRPRALKASLSTDLPSLHRIGLRVLSNPVKYYLSYVTSV
jgi:hypothetical protein